MTNKDNDDSQCEFENAGDAEGLREWDALQDVVEDPDMQDAVRLLAEAVTTLLTIAGEAQAVLHQARDEERVGDVPEPGTHTYRIRTRVIEHALWVSTTWPKLSASLYELGIEMDADAIEITVDAEKDGNEELATKATALLLVKAYAERSNAKIQAGIESIEEEENLEAAFQADSFKGEK